MRLCISDVFISVGFAGGFRSWSKVAVSSFYFNLLTLVRHELRPFFSPRH